MGSAVSSAPLDQLRERLGAFQCPACTGDLLVGGKVRCTQCGREYPIDDGIPRFYVAEDADASQESLTQRVREFYEETPFPNYEDMESIEDLIAKAERGRFARLLNDQLPFNARVLEVGCGTGQLSNYLGVAQRSLFGADMTMNSLRLANGFRERHGLDNVGFYQMNLYRPPFKEEAFDVVLCNGVLCATAEPYRGFQSVSRLVRRGGYLLIGTYNTYGRIITDLRRAALRAFGERLTFLDPRLRSKNLGSAKKRAWLEDQYRHPYETKQSFGEVLGWFRKHGIEFMFGIPSPKAFVPFSERSALFEPHPCGNWLDHAIVQTQLMFQGSYEGGFFLMIGRRS